MPDRLTRPDGRWARILAALAERPLSAGAIMSRARNPEHSRQADRRKCKRAILRMADAGLIAGTWRRLEITDHGRMSFARVLSAGAANARSQAA